MQDIWDEFPGIYQRVRATHEQVQVASHPWMVAMRVGNIAQRIAKDEWGSSDSCAGIAGMCSNAIHIIMKRDSIKERRDVQPAAMAALILEWIGEDVVLLYRGRIVAIVQQQGEKDAEGDPEDLIALRDAMRVTGLDFDLYVRSGALHHELPIFDYRYGLEAPGVTYRKPGSIMKDIVYSLDWVTEGSGVCCRTRLGLQMAKRRAIDFKANLDRYLCQLEEEGVWPYPFKT